ncbi:unnamed protein product, partial [Protopolystoma xenopodis]
MTRFSVLKIGSNSLPHNAQGEGFDNLNPETPSSSISPNAVNSRPENITKEALSKMRTSHRDIDADLDEMENELRPEDSLDSLGRSGEVEDFGAQPFISTLDPRPDVPNQSRGDSNEPSPGEDYAEVSESAVEAESSNAQLAHLNEMVSEIDRYSGMAERLYSITEEASVRGHRELSDEFRSDKLNNLRDFMVKLSLNFKATRDCFFTVARLARTTINEHIANGSLRDREDDEIDEEEDVSNFRRGDIVDSGMESPGIETKKNADSHVQT